MEGDQDLRENRDSPGDPEYKRGQVLSEKNTKRKFATDRVT